MTSLRKILFFSVLLAALLSYTGSSYAQGSPDYKGGMKIGLDEEGKRYLRLITLQQVQADLQGENSDGTDKDFNVRLRRSRFLALAKITDDFLVLTHFGANSAAADDLSPVGADGTTRTGLFMHAAWVEYSILGRYLAGGAGLHYWNGISRLTNQSTLNIMTLDAPGFNWPTIGTTDQFGRHLGLYLKGDWEGKLHYRFALNRPTANSLDTTRDNTLAEDTAVYRGVELRNFDPETGEEDPEATNGGSLMVFQGYVSYNLLGTESSFLPYTAGSYLGSKGAVLSVGAGFFMHPEGSVSGRSGSCVDSESQVIDTPQDATTDEACGTDTDRYDADVPFVDEKHDVTHIGVDVFYEQPVGDSMAFNGYLVYYSYDFGPNYIHPLFSGTAGTGTIIYTQLGYLFKWGEKGRGVQPYITYSQSSLDAYEDEDKYADSSVTTTGLGVNYFISGHNAKISAEYKTISNPNKDDPETDPKKEDAADDQSIVIQFAVYI